MSIEQTKALMYRFVEIVASGDADALDAIVADDFIEHSPDSPSGPTGLKQFVRMIHNGFSDVEATVEDVIAEEGKVGGRVLIRGTHRGEFLGFQPTGKRLHSVSLDLFRVADGKLAEHWEVVDRIGIMQSLGVQSAEGNTSA
jgi:steroid delta-isomerase-like uncharacterized protein